MSPLQVPRGITVESLIKDGIREWDVQKVNQNYPQDIAKEILDIPLSRLGTNDSLVWTRAKTDIIVQRVILFWRQNADPKMVLLLELFEGMQCRLPLERFRKQRPLQEPYSLFGDSYWMLSHLLKPSGITMSPLMACACFVGITQKIEIVYFFGVRLPKPTFMFSQSRFHNLDCWLRYWIHRWRRDKDHLQDIWLDILVTLHHIWFVRNNLLWKGVKPGVEGAITSITVQVKNYLVGAANNKSPSRTMVSGYQLNPLVGSNDWIAFNVVKFNNTAWFVAVSGKANVWTYIFSNIVIGPNSQARKDTSGFLLFMRDCILKCGPPS